MLSSEGLLEQLIPGSGPRSAVYAYFELLEVAEGKAIELGQQGR